MKKIFILAICLFLVKAASAQRYFYGPQSDYSNSDFYQTRFGFEAGVNISNIVNAPGSSFSTGTLAGFTAGINVDIPITFPLSFETGLIYSQKGYRAQTPNGGFTQRSQFIELPLLAKLSIGPIFSLYAGPQFSYLVSAQNSYNNGFVATTQQYYLNQATHTFLDGVVGVGFNINRFVDIHARYAIDLKQTAPNGNIYVPAYNNQAWQVGFGFKF